MRFFNCVFNKVRLFLSGIHNADKAKVFKGCVLNDDICLRSSLENTNVDNMKTVLFVVNSVFPYESSGYAYRSYHIMKAYKKLGFKIYIISKIGSFRMNDVVSVGFGYRTSLHESTEIAILDCFRKTSDVKYAKKFGEAILNFSQGKDIDFIHASSNYIVGLSALHAARKLSIPLLYEVRGMWHVTHASKEKGFSSTKAYKHEEAMERWVIQNASAVLFITNELRKEYLSKPQLNTAVLPNCIDSSVRRYSQGRSNIATSKFRLLYAGSIVFYEGLDLLVQVVSKLERMDIELSIYGDGPDFSKLERLVSRLGSKNVSLHGRVDQTEVKHAYKSHHAVVVPRILSQVTSLVPPLKPLEAVWNGLPVITSDLPAIREIMGDVGAALYIEPSNVHSLRNGIIKLQREYEEYAAKVKSDQVYIQKERSWDQQLGKAIKDITCS